MICRVPVVDYRPTGTKAGWWRRDWGYEPASDYSTGRRPDSPFSPFSHGPRSRLAGADEIAIIPPHCPSLVDGASQVARRLTLLAKDGCRFLPALQLSAITLALACGCQNDGELANPNEGLAKSLAPRNVDDYARQRNISRDQAQRELQDAVGKRDTAEAVKNVDEAGVVTDN